MEQDADDIGGEALLPLQWIVESASSQSELHPGSDVLERDSDKPWLTQKPTDDAWLVLAPQPPTAFYRVEIVNAGSGLLEIHGLREDAEGDGGDADYELLLSAQQVMSVKDLMSKSNRNQAFNYDIDGNHKLVSVAAQHRWRKIRVNCRQPFGTSEHRACIGLTYINFTPCHCKSESKIRHPKAKPAVTSTKRKLPSWLSSCESTDAAELLPAKKPKASLANSDVGIGLVDLEQGGSLNFEHAGAQGVELGIERKGRVPGSSETREEQASRRSSSLKRRSLDGDEIGGSKERKKAQKQVEKEIVQPAQDQLKDVVARAANERKGRDAQVKQPETSSQRKPNLSQEEKGRAKESEENQVSKDEAEREFSKLMKGVIFTISGLQNPERGQLRVKGLEMGAQYRPDWSSDCTLLVCTIMDTPKFKQVQANGGCVVSKDWISECHKKQKLVDFERFVLNKGRPWRLPDTSTEKEVKRKKVNCGSVEEIRKWAHEDLALTIDWLLQQDAKPEPEELEPTAAQGILVCLEDAVSSLAGNQGLSSMIENWGFLPRAVKELAAMEEEDEHAKTSTSTLLEAERLKGIYDEVLTVFLAPSKKSPTVIDQTKPGGKKEEGEEDDEYATEVMSDVDSQETVNYDSDDTVVLGSEAIVECTRKLVEKIRSK